ncbi:MAG: pentapeptide repeat-containing protein [Cyanobacteria bacterium J06581_3]
MSAGRIKPDTPIIKIPEMQKQPSLTVLTKSAIASLLIVGATGAIAHAENPDHMRQLLRTGDCPDCDLSSASLSQLNLTEANLQGADLSNTRFDNVQLLRANLSSANLSGATFQRANLTGANLQNANLSDASSLFLCSEDISGFGSDTEDCVTQLLWFRLAPEVCAEGSELSALLSGVLGEDSETFCADNGAEYFAYSSAYAQIAQPGLILRGADLSGANLQNAVLSGADFDYAVLTDAEADNAQLDYATLFYADLSSLKNADLTEAWESPQALVDWVAVIQAKAEEESRQNYGRTHIGSISRAQQAYYYENEAFASEIVDLGVSEPKEDSLFDFGILEQQSTDDKVVQYALNRAGDLPSVINFVWSYADPEADGESYLYATTCESDEARVFAVSDLPEISISDEEGTCPEGWTSTY